MGASTAHRHCNPITDCSDQKRRVRKRHRTGKGGREALYSTCPTASSLLDKVLPKFTLPRSEEKDQLHFTIWSSIKTAHSFFTQSCIYILKSHEIASIQECVHM